MRLGVRVGLTALAVVVAGWAALFAQALGLLHLAPAVAGILPWAAAALVVGGLVVVIMTVFGLDGLRLAFVRRLDGGAPVEALFSYQLCSFSFVFSPASRPPRLLA